MNLLNSDIVMQTLSEVVEMLNLNFRNSIKLFKL